MTHRYHVHPRGLYGVRIEGFDDVPSLGFVPADWPGWTVEVRSGEDQPAETGHVGTDSAQVTFGDGAAARLERRDPGGHMDLDLPRPVDRGDLGHPYFAILGMVSAYWRGWIPFHAGSFEADGRAWLIPAEKGHGKSTTLALVGLAGHAVLADDLAVIDRELRVYRGPRFVDLRQETSEHLGIGEYKGVLGIRERWRYDLPDAPDRLPLGGIVVPEWGEENVETMTARDRLGLVGRSLSLRVPGDWGELLMDVVLTVPVLRWTRPRDLNGARAALHRLIPRLAAL